MTQKKWSTCLWCDWGVEKLLFWHEFVKTKPLFLHLRRPKCHQWFNFAIKHGWDFPELFLKIYESFHRRIIELNGGLDENHLYMGNFPAHVYTGGYLLPLSLQTSWLPASLTGDTWSWQPARIMRQNSPFLYSAPFWTIRHWDISPDVQSAQSSVRICLHRFGCWSIQHSPAFRCGWIGEHGAITGSMASWPLTMLGTNQKAGPLPIETREIRLVWSNIKKSS